MAIVVQKYGGTSLNSIDHIKKAAQSIIEEKEKGNQLVVVVSAMGKKTNELSHLAKSITADPHPREMDLLLSTGEQVACSLMALALKEQGADAVAMTGGQAGIQTETVFGNAAISSINTGTIEKMVSMGKIVVVAGFQGCTNDGDICTLGRGGSDTTAAALAAELKAERCDILTDVDGVYTSDPRRVPAAKKLSILTYEDMLALAEMGAGVVHPRAVSHAMDYQVPLFVRSSFHQEQGTRIQKDSCPNESFQAIGITFERGVAKIDLTSLTTPLEKGPILEILEEAGVQIRGNRQNDKAFSMLVQDQDLYQTLSLLNRKKAVFNIATISHHAGMAAVHVIGKQNQPPEIKQKLLDLNYQVYESKSNVLSAAVSSEKMIEAAQHIHKWMIEKSAVSLSL